MNNENKYLNLILFKMEGFYIASSLMTSETLEKGEYTMFWSDKWDDFRSIIHSNKWKHFNSSDDIYDALTQSGGYFYLDADNIKGYILFDSPTIEEAKKCIEKLLRYYKKDDV